MLIRILMLMILTLCGGLAFGQGDIGIPDSIIIGRVAIDSEVTQIRLPVYVRCDETLGVFNIPLTWSPADSGITPINVEFADTLHCWALAYDSILYNLHLIRTIGFNDLIDTTYTCPTFPDTQRLQLFSIIFSVSQGTPPITIAIDTIRDPRNGAALFGLADGITEIRPAISPGQIQYQPAVGIDDGSPNLPLRTGLKQNYPNPFNPSTKIEFSISKQGYVTLEIFDILGRRTKKLIDNNIEVGSYSLIWTAEDESGNDVPSGIYFYKLTAAGFSETKKMLLIR